MKEPLKVLEKPRRTNGPNSPKTWADKIFGVNRYKSQNPSVWYQPFLGDGEHILWQGGIKRKLVAFEIASYLLALGAYLLIALCLIYRKSLNDSLWPMIGLIAFLFFPTAGGLTYQSWLSRMRTHALLTNQRMIFKYPIFHEAIGCIDYKNISGIRTITRKFGKQLLTIDGIIEDLKKDINSKAILNKIGKPILLVTDNAEQVRQVLEEAIRRVQ